MTDARTLLQQALDALEEVVSYTSGPAWSPSMTDECNILANALRAHLAQPEAEPVAWMDDFGNTFPIGANKGSGHWLDDHKRTWVPLYTAPPTIGTI